MTQQMLKKERKTDRPEAEMQLLISPLSLTLSEPPILSGFSCQVRVFMLAIAKLHPSHGHIPAPICSLAIPVACLCMKHNHYSINSCICPSLFTLHEISSSLSSHLCLITTF